MNKHRPLLALLASAVLCAAGHDAAAQNPIPPSPLRPPPARSAATSASAPGPDAATTTPAASSAPATTSSNSTAAASADYILSASDAVEMTVFRQPDLSTQTKIANDGTVQFPLIGELKIGGLTLRDARELIRKRYNADYLVDPQVYLNVTAYATRKFTVLGQVNNPGTYMIPGGEHLGLMEAVGMANGFTRIADRGSVVIRRTDHGKEQTIKVNTKRDGKFEVAPGDVITVGETWL